MARLEAGSLISGQEGRAYIKADGKNQELMYLREITAVLTKKKKAVRTLGRRGEQYRTAGYAGSGVMKAYYVSSLFRKQAIDYIRTGVDTYFDILVVNDDPQSGFGSQSVVLKNCTVDKVTLARLDVDSDFLDEELTFTFEDAELLDSFSA
ncbi:MAG: phage tail tube protein [Oscillospiraceae bacterium]|nr:phage tail tube protein [Oscillospiraceae bacterium]